MSVLNSHSSPPQTRDEVHERLTTYAPAGCSQAVCSMEALVWLLRANSAVHEALNENLHPYGISLAQYNLLAVLKHVQGHRLPMSEIGARMHVTRTNITKLADGLEKAGYLTRVHCADDRRVVYAELSDLALELMGRIAPIQWQFNEMLWSDLSKEECRTVAELLCKLESSVINARHRSETNS